MMSLANECCRHDLLITKEAIVKLPTQSPPISRDLLMHGGHQNGAGVEASGGVQAAQTVCDRLHGLARQMCYATEYGVSV